MSRNTIFNGYRLHTLIWIYFLLSLGVLGVTVDEVKTVKEGETVTIHTGFAGLLSDVQILWAYGPVDPKTKIVQSQVLRGEIITEYSDRFRDRLQLDRQTGSLTIRNINITDSGVYKVQIINGEISYKTFSFTVYATVPAPHIRVKQSRSAGSGSSGPKCSVECSVENGRDVTLSWYKGGKSLNQTSSPDLNTILSLPLKIEDQDNNNYSCVADNPVSHQTTQLSKELCPHSPAVVPPGKLHIWTISLTVLILTLLILAFFIWRMKRKRQSEEHTEELNYCVVQASTQNIPQTVEQGTDEASEILYSTIRS